MLDSTALPAPSALLVASFVVIAVLVAGAFPLLVYRADRALGVDVGVARRRAGVAALATIAWMAVTGGAAAAGHLSFTGTPPLMLFALPIVLVVALSIAFSGVGRRLATGLPLAVLVGLQAFRLPLELAMHRAYTEGLMPIQMTYTGRNLDILSGIGALLLAPLVARGRAPRALVWAWNVAGTLLLANILVVSMLSAPTPMRVFMNEPANVWITRAPFVWLPAVMVLTAIYGHAVIFRALLRHERVEMRAALATPVTR